MIFIRERLSDLFIIDEIIINFENISGAILSRSSKSKVIGLGLWRDKLEWPLHWLRVMPMLKIFGFQVTASYKQTLQLSWDACFSGLRKTIMSLVQSFSSSFAIKIFEEV